MGANYRRPTSKIAGEPDPKRPSGKRSASSKVAKKSALQGAAAPNPLVARIAVRKRSSGTPQVAEQQLLQAFQKWPFAGACKFTITPGGFVFHRLATSWNSNRGWDSQPSDLNTLVAIAEPVVSQCVTKKVLAAAKKRTQFLTIGVDLASTDATAELVAVIDCSSGKIVRWSGKSYPTKGQESWLVQVADVGSHLIQLANENVLVLGCHDLNMFSPRSLKNQKQGGHRQRRSRAMARAVRAFNPTVVLHHPHDTDTPNIWRLGWSGLTKKHPTVRTYASSIAYFRSPPPRRPLTDVLAGTRSATGVVDIIV